MIRNNRIIHRWFAVAIALLAATLVSAQTAPEIARIAFASTVLLIMEDANGQQLSLGSGFLVADSVIASNLHVVKGAASGYANLVGKNKTYEVRGVTAIDPTRDLVILKIAPTDAPALSLGDSDSVQVGDRVYAVGNPLGLEGTFSQGIVSSIREIRTDRLLQITAPISPGSSGGPVLSSKGEVIGVSVATFTGGQNLNFAIPAEYLQSLLETMGPPRPLGEATAAEEKRSIVADLGSDSSEGVVGSHFAWTDIQFMGYYTFSVRNQLREPVRDVTCLVIFFARDGLPIEAEIVTIPGPVGGKLAVRSPQLGRLEADQVRNLTKSTEIRILGFQLASNTGL